MTVLLFVFLALTGLAQAHEPGLSYGEVQRDRVTVVVDVEEFADRFPTADIEAASLLLSEHTLGATWVSVGGERCQMGQPTVEPYEEDAVRVSAPMACPLVDGAWRYHPTWLRGREAGHRHVVSAFGQPVGILGNEDTTIVLDADPIPGALSVVLQFTWLGVEHILGGFDHLAFVIGLIVVMRSWREAGLIVTGFTLAHSVTLSLAAFNVVQLPASVVEPLIALSVAWIGVENLWFDPPAWRRALLTFALGLIHGFGFAGALGEIGLPWGQALVGLVSFNVGVELGQLALVALLLPVALRWAENERWQRFGVRGTSVLLVAVGLGWFVLRVMA